MLAGRANQCDPSQSSKLWVSRLNPIVPGLRCLGLPELFQEGIVT